MFNKLHINRLILPIVVAISIIIPAIAGSPTFAMSSMDNMGHSSVDIVDCMNQHQVPTPPTEKEIDHLKNEDDGAYQEPSYYSGLSTNYAEPKKQKTNLITSSSFRPPDIVILTSNLRI